MYYLCLMCYMCFPHIPESKNKQGISTQVVGCWIQLFYLLNHKNMICIKITPIFHFKTEYDKSVRYQDIGSV